MVEKILQSKDLDELLVEGGATASHLVRFLGWKNFKPLSEYSTGVVKLEIDKKPGCRLIVKPGSYPWPEELINNINH